MPSLYEGFSLPAIEAMSCGVPLVATTGGALPEVVGDDNETALLVPPGDSEALAARIRTALDDARAAGAVGAARPPAGHRQLELAAHRRAHASSSTGLCWRRRLPVRSPSARRSERGRTQPRGSTAVLTVRYDWLGLAAPATGCSTSDAAPAGTPSRRAPRRPSGGARLRRGRAQGRDGDVRAPSPTPRPARCRPRRRARLYQRRRHPAAVPRRRVRPRHRRRGARAHPRRRGGDRRAGPGAEARRHDGGHRAGVAGRAGLLGAVRRVPRPVRRRRPRAHLHRAASCARSCGPPACVAGRRAPRPRAAHAVLVAQVRGRARPTTTTRWCAPTTRSCCGTSPGASRWRRVTRSSPTGWPTRSSASRSSSTPTSRRRAAR